MYQKISDLIVELKRFIIRKEIRQFRDEFSRGFKGKTPEEKQRFVDSFYSSEERVEVSNALADDFQDNDLLLAVIEHASDQKHKMAAFDRAYKVFSGKVNRGGGGSDNVVVRNLARLALNHIVAVQDIKDRVAELLLPVYERWVATVSEYDDVIELLSEVRDITPDSTEIYQRISEELLFKNVDAIDDIEVIKLLSEIRDATMYQRISDRIVELERWREFRPLSKGFYGLEEKTPKERKEFVGYMHSSKEKVRIFETMLLDKPGGRANLELLRILEASTWTGCWHRWTRRFDWVLPWEWFGEDNIYRKTSKKIMELEDRRS